MQQITVISAEEWKAHRQEIDELKAQIREQNEILKKLINAVRERHPAEDWLTGPEAAKVLNVCRRTVSTMADRGDIERKVIAGQLRFRIIV